MVYVTMCYCYFCITKATNPVKGHLQFLNELWIEFFFGETSKNMRGFGPSILNSLIYRVTSGDSTTRKVAAISWNWNCLSLLVLLTLLMTSQFYFCPLSLSSMYINTHLNNLILLHVAGTKVVLGPGSTG